MGEVKIFVLLSRKQTGSLPGYNLHVAGLQAE